MSQREILKAIKEHVNRQDNDWKFIMGGEVLTKQKMIKKLNGDKTFRKKIVNLVVTLSIDILSRKPE